MSELEKPIYLFRGFELDPAERRLLGGGKPIALTPKVFDTLVLLVERAGHVISKDELIKTLWPRGYIDESNLTKHIWLIRRALGSGENDSDFIETVPRVGYRFVAPVTTGRESVEPTDVAATPPAPVAGSRKAWPWAIALAAVLLLVALVWRQAPRLGGSSLVSHQGRTVAFVGFANLSLNAKDAWLAPALTEILGAELNAAGDLQVIPDELVRDASTDLAPPAAGGYAPETLAKLRRRLDTDYVVSGSYLVAGASDGAPLRVDIALQDARNGALVASVSNQSSLSGLIALATHSGAALRGKLGVAQPGTEELGRVANVQPPSIDVARRIGFALDALQHYDAARARDELLEAVAQAPGYAPTYTYLSQAWSDLGYRDKALAAAGQAVEYSANLPPEQRLQAEAVVASLRGNWVNAADAWQTLAKLKPLSPEYRLQWIDAQIASGAAAQAQTTLTDLRRLPNIAGDPRIELAAARIARALDDAKLTAQHATLALQQARERDAAGLLADAQVSLAVARMHLNQNEEARTGLVAAIDAYRAIRNPRGEASARRALSEVLAGLNRAQDAREEYQRALTLYQSIGDIGGVASVYRDLCQMLWFGGDQDGARAAARNGLKLARETGDLPIQSWTLRALATIASDDAASEEVLSDYREVIALNERTGDRGGHVWSLASYADVARMRGDLDEASKYCARATAEAAALSDPQFAVYSGFTCALVSVDRGESDAARAALMEVQRRLGSGGDATYANNALMSLAQLDMDNAQWNAARERLRRASRGFAAAEEHTGEADALAMLALCAEALGDAEERDRAAERARTLRQAITTRQEVYVVDIALARLAEQSRQYAAAVDKLIALAADAERRHWIGWSLEAKLAAWELLRARDPRSAGALRGEIEATARKHGFERILNLLNVPKAAGG
ncbi:MAG TPA: winged helix-turn-helix domain-containing protein [Steroidobacteraceae bacterium]|jgi:DNA-binding winged helix-turn-helix (wHTH) protein/TolB-like protein